MAALKTLFNWLKVKRLIEVNPFDGVIVATDSQSYASLTPVFTSELYQPGTKPLASQWWLPLLSLHTGARPSEDVFTLSVKNIFVGTLLTPS